MTVLTAKAPAGSALARDIARLRRGAQLRAPGVATLSGCYRVTLRAKPWRLLIVAMPRQAPDAGKRTNPYGQAWDHGAAVAAAMIGSACGTDFREVPVPDEPEPARLAWAFVEARLSRP